MKSMFASHRLDLTVGRLSALHVVIVAMSLSLTLGAWLYSKHQVDLQVQGRFEAARDRTVRLIEDRMSRYEDALRSGVAHVESRDGQLTHAEWRVFANSLHLRETYPGVNGIGVIHYVERPDFPAYMAERAAEGRAFSVFPDHAQPFLLPITYIEPEDINAAAIGLDVAHEINRRTGLLDSRDSATARITGPIVLVQDSGHTPGFLFYAPFYRGTVPATLEERRARFAGVVYAPFVVRNLVEGLLSKDLREVRFSLRDGERTIYDEHGSDEPLHDAEPMFEETVALDLYGRTWMIDIRTNAAFRAANGYDQPTLILIGGLIIEVLVISFLVMLARSNHRAHDYARQLTGELRAKSETLEKANAAIEQFVYIASHDLKTPARGIGFLADVLEEDLEEMVGPLDPKGEIKSQLDMIRDRVERMNDLTEGILEFSRVSQPDGEPGPGLSVGALVTDCVADFDVEGSQITLDTDVDRIACDSHNFRRVIENLVGNAFKYHPRRGTARVWLTMRDSGDRLRVSVRDDGDGIAPEFQDRVFEVFQTLRKSGDPESTGIGLAIVRKAVQRHGFEVRVTSAEGQGADFSFDWPRTAGGATGPLEHAA
ncbi:CHASE domain-containing protein [Maliponia aquimaris]|uniref:CHASE domain-containing protein n=1 Tax=Maliponia aquimaris TaxID=1673631 RepID=UPI001FE72EFC|nr:CHASE domain-containing protein [Maliponia aquimaris]